MTHHPPALTPKQIDDLQRWRRRQILCVVAGMLAGLTGMVMLSMSLILAARIFFSVALTALLVLSLIGLRNWRRYG